MTKKKETRGRPRKITADVVHKLEHAFMNDANVLEACVYADISTSAFYTWLKEQPNFKDRIQALRGLHTLKAKEQLIKDLDNDDKWIKNNTAKYLLERKYGKPSQQVEVKGNLGIVITRKTYDEVSGEGASE